MNQLIRISTGSQGESVVSARELFEFLGFNRSQWSRWSKKNIVNNQFAAEGTDWTGFDIMSNGNETNDFAISLDFAKKLSMKAPTEKGEQVRQYFIDVEKALQKVTLVPLSTEHAMLQLIAQQTRLLAENQQMIAQLRTDVDLIQDGHKSPPSTLTSSKAPISPPTAGTAQNPNLRPLLQARISAYCNYHQADYSETYNYLYRRLHDVYGVNVHRLNRTGTDSLLDTIERYGRLADLYKLATNELIYPTGEPASIPVRKPTLDTIGAQDLQAILRRAFVQENSLGYTELRANLIEASAFVAPALAKSRTERFIIRAVKLGYLLKRREPSQRYERYWLNLEWIGI